jgi:predicted RNase H-like HicB family nuclease
MGLSYTYEKGEKYLVGHFDEYPEYPAQGKDIADLEEHLEEIYRWIQDGTLKLKKQKRKGIKMAVTVKPVQFTEIKDKRIAREVIEYIRKPIPAKIIRRNEKFVAYMKELER